ncbi:alpha/beta fold hydrolase [Bordetella petrii]|nr:alpha/beta fold hydrolase [Bordetella petrii]
MENLWPKKFIDVDGVRTAYIECGDGHSPALLLPSGLFSRRGVCSDAQIWEHNISSLAQNRRVIALDTLGQGSTSMPTSAVYTFDSVFSHCSRFLEIIGTTKMHLVGHDEGGLLALLLAIEYPERVASCTIVSSPTLAPSGDGVPSDPIRAPIQPLYSRSSQAWVLAQQSFTSHHVYTGHFLDAATNCAQTDAFEANLRNLKDPDIALNLTRSVMAAKARALAHARDQGVSAPILLIWGTEDPMSSASYVRQWGTGTDSNSSIGYARALFDLFRIKQAQTRLSLMTRVGYMPFREKPEEFNVITAGFQTAAAA